MKVTWIAIEHAGTDKERIVHEEEERNALQRWIKNTYLPVEILLLGVDMLKKMPDGTLTTEY